jgi:hypothetical protein
MKRMLLMTVTSTVLALAAPGVASASHPGKRHHGARHAGVHKRRARRARTITFPTTPILPAAGGSTTTPAPTQPAPSPPAGETAGTVASFANGLLTINLSNGSTVGGQVTEQTELECLVATPPQTTSGEDDQGGGDDVNGAEGGEHGGTSAQGQQIGRHQTDGQQGYGGDEGQGDEGSEGEHDGNQQSCTTAALVPGAVVREAELKMSGAGAVWEKVELVQ